MSNQPTDDQCYRFYLSNDRAIRPRYRELPNGNVTFAICSPEAFTVEGGGLGVIYPGIRILPPSGVESNMRFTRPDWMPRRIGVTAQTDGPDGDILVYIVNQNDFPLHVGRQAWLIQGVVERRDLTLWERFLAFIGLLK